MIVEQVLVGVKIHLIVYIMTPLIVMTLLNVAQILLMLIAQNAAEMPQVPVAQDSMDV